MSSSATPVFKDFGGMYRPTMSIEGDKIINTGIMWLFNGDSCSLLSASLTKFGWLNFLAISWIYYPENNILRSSRCSEGSHLLHQPEPRIASDSLSCCLVPSV